MKRAAVVGGTGFTGSYISSLLARKGFEVLALTGHTSRKPPLAEVKLSPFNFDRPELLVESLQGCNLLFNTYWVRFELDQTTFAKAIENTRSLFGCAKRAGVKRIVHISIANPSEDSPYPYYRGKAAVELELSRLGVPFTIVRPALVFGKGDILINNIAWVLRHFRMFPIFGDFSLSPVFVEDLARLAVECSEHAGNETLDCAGPESFSFRELVETIRKKIGVRALLFGTTPALALRLSAPLGWLVHEPVVTRDEMGALLDNLLFIRASPLGTARLTSWLESERESLGRAYASEVARHFKN